MCKGNVSTKEKVMNASEAAIDSENKSYASYMLPISVIIILQF